MKAQHMGSAPLDGTVILVRFAIPQWLLVAGVKEDKPPWRYWAQVDYREQDDETGKPHDGTGWYTDGTEERIFDEPTHWVELPEVE